MLRPCPQALNKISQTVGDRLALAVACGLTLTTAPYSGLRLRGIHFKLQLTGNGQNHFAASLQGHSL
jgi:hypothetical protein